MTLTQDEKAIIRYELSCAIFALLNKRKHLLQKPKQTRQELAEAQEINQLIDAREKIIQMLW